MNVAPINPLVAELVEAYNINHVNKIDAIKHLYWLIMSKKRNIQMLDPFLVTGKPLPYGARFAWKQGHSTLLLVFEVESIFNILEVHLKTLSRNAVIKILLNRIPEVQALQNVDVLSGALCEAISAVLLDTLDDGRSITSSPESSRSSTGASTPGCLYLG